MFFTNVSDLTRVLHAGVVNLSASQSQGGHDSDLDTLPGAQKAKPLSGKRILLVEDEAMVAMDIEYGLLDRGADVIGPAGTLEDAQSLINKTQQISAAILDVRLHGEDVYPAAHELTQRGVPILFHTGHGVGDEIHPQFPDARVVMKPQSTQSLLDILADLIPE